MHSLEIAFLAKALDTKQIIWKSPSEPMGEVVEFPPRTSVGPDDQLSAPTAKLVDGRVIDLTGANINEFQVIQPLFALPNPVEAPEHLPIALDTEAVMNAVEEVEYMGDEGISSMASGDNTDEEFEKARADFSEAMDVLREAAVFLSSTKPQASASPSAS